jgi:hypothetical protein
MVVLLSEKTFGSLWLQLFGAANVLKEKNTESLVGSTNTTEPITLLVIAIRQTSDFLHHFAAILPLGSVPYFRPKTGSPMRGETILKSNIFTVVRPSITFNLEPRPTFRTTWRHL